MIKRKETVMESGRTENQNTLLTVEKYISGGKLSRVVIKTNRKDYLLDLPLNSFTARSFLNASISLVKAFSLVIQNFNVAVVKFTTGNLV